MTQTNNLTENKNNSSRILLRVLLASIFMLAGTIIATAKLAQAEEVPFAIYDEPCYNFNSNTNENSNTNDNSSNANINSDTGTCNNTANYFNAQSQRGWETNLWRMVGGYTAQWHLPEPTKLTYNYSVTYYVYRDNNWVALADVGNKIFYGEKVKAEVTKNAEWTGNSGWWWDTPAAHFKDSFDWSDVSGCFADDYFGETDITNGSDARWNRWGMLDDEGHLGFQGSRLTGPVIFKNPTVDLIAAGFTCNGSECTAPTTNGTYTLQAKTEATEARQRFFGLVQSGGIGNVNLISQLECQYPGDGFPDPTRSCREVCGAGVCPLYPKMPGETNDQCYARAKNDFKSWWDCKDKGYLAGCMPITYVNLPMAEAGNFPSASYQKTMPVVEASAYIPGWPKDPQDTAISVTVGPPENSDIPQVTVTPGKSELLEGEENEVTCSVTNPVSTEKITQIKWSCLDNSSNQMVNCSLLGSSGWITGSEYVVDIPEANQASTYTSVIKAKSSVSGDYTVKCSATNSASITGEGFAGFKVGNCLADGVCNQLCPYDPDCCQDPYCMPYCPGYGNPHCVIDAGTCIVSRINPDPNTKEIKTGDKVSYQANVLGGNDPIGYDWACDKNTPSSSDHSATTNRTDNKTCQYNKKGDFEPIVSYQYLNKEGKSFSQDCINAQGTSVNVTGGELGAEVEASVKSCKVGLNKDWFTPYSKNLSVTIGDEFRAKIIALTENGQEVELNKGVVDWKFNNVLDSEHGLSITKTANTVGEQKISATLKKSDGTIIPCSDGYVGVKETIQWGAQ